MYCGPEVGAVFVNIMHIWLTDKSLFTELSLYAHFFETKFEILKLVNLELKSGEIVKLNVKL